MVMIVKRRMPLAVKIILIVLAALIVVPVIVIGIFMLLSPISDNMDKSKFEKLDSQSREIFSQVKAAAGDDGEDWTYRAKCEAETTGDWPTGRYWCTTQMEAYFPVTTATEHLALHDKYYSLFERSYYLKEKQALKKQFPEDFGTKFVVSGAEKKYLITAGDDIVCDYLAELTQPYDKFNSLTYTYGSPISGDKGRVYISLDCTGIASGNWYSSDL